MKSKDEIKLAKKELTRLSNKCSNYKNAKLYKLSKDMSETYYSAEYGNEDEVLRHAFFNVTRTFPKCVENLKVIAESLCNYPEYQKRVMEFYTDLSPMAKEALELEAEIEKALDDLEGGNGAERAIKSLIASEKNEEKAKMLNKFLKTLKNWKEPTIENKIMEINGSPIDNEDFVGVIIGSGKKIHMMRASACVDKKGEEFIGLSNYTQWRNSWLCIVDKWENIPEEVKAYNA